MKNFIKSAFEDEETMDISTVKEEWVNEGYDKDIVEKFFDENEFVDDDEVTYKDERVLRKEFEKYSLNSSRKIRSSKVIKSAMDDETMWDAFEDIKNTLFNTLSGMSWLSKKGSRLDSLCEDLTAQIIGFDMDRDPSDILNEYLS